MRAARVVRGFHGGEKAQIVDWRCAEWDAEPLVNVGQRVVHKASVCAASGIDCKEGS